MAKQSAMWRQWFGAAVIGAAVFTGASGGAWGQDAKPDAAAMAEVERLNVESLRLRSEGELDQAITLAERALAIGEKALGKDNPNMSTLLGNLAGLYHDKREYVRAVALYLRALAIVETVIPPDHPEMTRVARVLNNLAVVYHDKRDYARAEPLLLRALSIREKWLRSTHPDIASSLFNLADLYISRGDHTRAEPLLLRALRIRENALGLDDPGVAQVLNKLAMLYLGKGDYGRAEPLLKRALHIRENAPRPNHVDVAASLNNLAFLYDEKGDYARAEPHYQRALDILERVYGPVHADVATTLNNLAMVYKVKGDYVRALPLLQRALSIRKQLLSPDDPGVASSLNNLGALYVDMGDRAQAEPLYLRALSITEKALGADHPNVAPLLNNLAEIYMEKSDYGQAEPLLLRALGIRKKQGQDHPDVALSLNSLATLYFKKGDYARAKPLHQQALALQEKALGPDHPHVAHSLSNLSRLHWWGQKDIRSALRDAERAASITDRNAMRELAIGTDEQRRAYMQALRETTEYTIFLHFMSAPEVENAKQLALRTILRRKGLVLDAMSNSFATLRQRLTPPDQQKFDEWRSLTAQYSALAQRQPGSNALQAIKDKREKLENELSFRSKDLQGQLKPVTIEQVQAAIPAGAVLVELFRHDFFNPKRERLEDESGTAIYVAYVLHPTGRIDYISLGQARPIEDAVKTLRNNLSRAATDPKPAAQNLYQLVMEPIQKLLGKTRHVYLSPDGALNLVPFGAMMTEDGHYLAETHAITYLPSGRDLVRMGNSAPSRQGAAIFAAPGYELGDKTKERSLHQFTALRYSADEAQSITSTLQGAKTFLGAAATEDAVKALHAPKILHISTHGFFAKDDPALHATPDDKPRLIENALLHSGLGFAGANRGGIGKEDGLLTALEASQLDLWGTKLVVLSACETGMGQAENGDSVYGLRRAFTMAGAETVVMSLWQVDANATTDLMKAYYQGLSAHEGRAEALRQAQLAMLSSADRAHPHYWASFIAAGDDRSMEGKPVDPSFARVNRAGGCGACEISGSTNDGGGWGFLAMAIGVGIGAGRRKRYSQKC